MEAIRNVLGKPIVRVETNDFEQMEKVSRFFDTKEFRSY